MSLFPNVTGGAVIRAQTHSFIEALRRRIDAGVLPHAPARRRRYVISRQDRSGLGFRAADWWTALYVGLNDVDVNVPERGQVRFVIRYERWAAYALGLSAVIGFGLIAWLLLTDMDAYIATHPTSRFPGLPMRYHIAFAWAMALFWGFVWPWIIIALHKRPVRRLLEQIIAEVDADAVRAA